MQIGGYVEMDLSMVEFINVVGFPISVSIALFWYNREIMKDNRVTETEFRQALNQNTEVMRELVSLIKDKNNV